MILRARWVVPVVGPILEDGYVEIARDRIIAVGRFKEMHRPTETVEDLGDAVLLPGFINAHTHLELSCYKGQIAPTDFWSWLEQLISLRNAPGTAERERQAVIDGARKSLSLGVTCVADISRTGLNLAALQTMPIRKVCFLELISGAMTPPSNFEELRENLADALSFADELTCVGLSPHAIYSVLPDDIAQTAALAAERNLPLTMHVAETREELEWLDNGSGRVADFLKRYGLLTAAPAKNIEVNPAARGGHPLDLLDQSGALSERALLAHVNYVDDDALPRLSGSMCSVVYCPRAHRFFGHPPHRWPEMLAAGVNVCLGTDGLVCNDTLSMLDEIHFVHERHPDVPGQQLLELATVRAAHALGLDDEIGRLAPGHQADLVSVPMLETSSSDQPWSSLLGPGSGVQNVWVAGRRVVKNGDYIA
jgi:cytosine/adenosine deaminase-related metal-dependent hydrolase